MIRTVKDLQKILNDVDQDLQIVIETDHEQLPSNIYWAGVAKFEIEEGIVLHPDEYNTYPNAVDVLYIQGE